MWKYAVPGLRWFKLLWLVNLFRYVTDQFPTCSNTHRNKLNTFKKERFPSYRSNFLISNIFLRFGNKRTSHQTVARDFSFCPPLPLSHSLVVVIFSLWQQQQQKLGLNFCVPTMVLSLDLQFPRLDLTRLMLIILCLLFLKSNCDSEKRVLYQLSTRQN